VLFGWHRRLAADLATMMSRLLRREPDIPDLVPDTDVAFPSGASEEVVVASLQGYFGPRRWAGVRARTDDRLVVAAVGVTDDDRAWVMTTFGPDADRIVLVATRYSHEQLVAYMHAVTDLLVAGAPDADKASSVGASVELDAVRIERTGPTPALDAFLAEQSVVPPEAIAPDDGVYEPPGTWYAI
jgi:hypothetical protein